MCGICGQLRLDNQAVKPALLEAMMAKLVRRGPDYGHHIVRGNIGLGHRRLSIIDLSSQGNQPMIDAKLGLELVFNGTIYNYRALRAELISFGYQFNSHSDTETIIKAYAHWGADCVHHLDGAFAFSLWDNKKKQLMLARDRMGIKPLYISTTNQAISFASTIQALLPTQPDTSINATALENQLSLHGVVPAPNTILEGVKKLKPGHYQLINQAGKTKTIEYWYPSAQTDNDLNLEQHLEKTHDLLKQAVQKRMFASDVPIGVLLSGGLDSSLLVGILAELGQQDIRTFSIGFEDIGQESGSEFIYSDQIVDKFNTQHQKYVIANSQVLARLPDAVAQMSEPMVGQDAVAFYLLSEQVAKSVKVVLSGQGADEAYAGYFWYPKMQNEQGDELERFSKHYLDRPNGEYQQTVNADYHCNNSTADWIQKQLNKPHGDDFLNKVLRMDITRLIVDDPVKRVDNMTMAWGLEARVPFMDKALVEHALSIPAHIKLKEEGKFPLKHIARGLLPDSVIDRKKGYFPMPALKYVRGEFLDFMADILNSQACRNRGVFNQNYVSKLINNPEQYMTALNGSRLWHLALLEFWLQTNIDKK